MKKLFIYASLVGITTGIAYWLYKKGGFNKTPDKSVDNKVDFAAETQEKDNSQHSDVVEEMYQTKNESVQAVYERRSEASEIMKDAYTNIMEDFVEVFPNEKDADDTSKKVVIDSESVSVMQEIDSISNELDDLLK